MITGFIRSKESSAALSTNVIVSLTNWRRCFSLQKRQSSRGICVQKKEKKNPRKTGREKNGTTPKRPQVKEMKEPRENLKESWRNAGRSEKR